MQVGKEYSSDVQGDGPEEEDAGVGFQRAFEDIDDNEFEGNVELEEDEEEEEEGEARERLYIPHLQSACLQMESNDSVRRLLPPVRRLGFWR